MFFCGIFFAGFRHFLYFVNFSFKKHIIGRQKSTKEKRMKAHNSRIVAISIIASILIGGCATRDNALNITDLNISKNSILVEHENIKSATAILIKKTEMCDRLSQEQKTLSSSIAESNSRNRELFAKIDEMNTRLSMFTDEIGFLKTEIENLKSKSREVIHPIVQREHDDNQTVDINTSIKNIVVPKIPKVSAAKVSSKSPRLSTQQKKRKQSVQECTVNAKQERSNEPKQNAIKIVVSSPVAMNFQDVTGRIIVNHSKVFVRTSPELTAKSVSTHVQEGDVFTYVAKNKDWFKLKSGKYISSKVVVDLSEQNKK